MSTYTTSRNTRGQHVSPKWTSRPYRPHPSRRESIHGKVQGLPDRRDPTAKWFLWLAAIIAVFFALQFLRLPLLGAKAASVAIVAPHATASTSAPFRREGADK